MHYWARIVGSGEIAFRIPSVLFGLGTIWVVYLIGRKRSRVGNLDLWGALLMATAPYHIYYSQEARMYSMVTFFSSLSMLFFFKIIRLANSSTKSPDKKRRFSIPFGYILFTGLALYSDYYAIFVVLAQIIAGTIILRKRMIKLFFYYLFFPILFLPALPLLASQIKTGIVATQALPGWGRLVNLGFFKALPLTFVKFTIGRITIFNRTIYALAGLGTLGLLGLIGINGANQAKKKKEEKSFFLSLLLWLSVPLLFSLVASLLVPNYQPFRLLLVLPAFYLLLAYGISTIPSRPISVFFTLLVLLINACSLLTYYRNSYFWREDWRGVADFVKKENSYLVISGQAFNWPLVYYQASNQLIEVAPGAGLVGESLENNLLSRIKNQNRLYYTQYLADIYDPAGLVPQWLEKANFVKIREISFNQIPVWEYRRH